MKTLLSIFAVTLALAFTGPAFAGDVTAAKTEADCAKAGGTWMLRPTCAKRKRCKSSVALAHITKGRRLRSAPFFLSIILSGWNPGT